MATMKTEDAPVGLAAQRPLPTGPMKDLPMPSQTTPDTSPLSQNDASPGTSKEIPQSTATSAPAMEMEVDRRNSPSDDANAAKLQKKRKGQKFYCIDYPPCNLSFTRSEHLARHIRKHTGERPFQCHCGRKFSRLDNLRQHAQTVHMHEDIPPNSLAAASVKIQKHVRADRMLPPNGNTGGRSRSSTLNCTPGRVGHSRTQSQSSIMSNGSLFNMWDDDRNRPHPMNLNIDPAFRDEGSWANDAQRAAHYRQHSLNSLSSGSGTPTSAFHSHVSTPYFAHRPSSGTPGSPLDFNSPIDRRNSLSSSHGPTAHPYHMMPTHPSPYGPPFSPYAMISSPTSATFAGDHTVEVDRRRTWAAPSNYAEQVAGQRHYGQDISANRLSTGSNASSVQLPGIGQLLSDADRANQPQSMTPNRLSASSDTVQQGIDRTGYRDMPMRYSNNRPPSGDWTRGYTTSGASSRPSTGNSLGAPFEVNPTAYHSPTSGSFAHPATPGLEHSPTKTDRAARRRGFIGPPSSMANQHRTPEDSGSSDGVPTPHTGTSVDQSAPRIRDGTNGSWNESRPTSMDNLNIDPALKTAGQMTTEAMPLSASSNSGPAQYGSHDAASTPRSKQATLSAGFELGSPSALGRSAMHTLSSVGEERA